MTPDNRPYDDMTPTTAVRYGGTSTATYRIDNIIKIEEPEDFSEQEDLEWRKREEKFAVINFNNRLPSNIFVKYIPIKQKRFKQKVKY